MLHLLHQNLSQSPSPRAWLEIISITRCVLRSSCIVFCILQPDLYWVLQHMLYCIPTGFWGPHPCVTISFSSHLPMLPIFVFGLPFFATHYFFQPPLFFWAPHFGKPLFSSTPPFFGAPIIPERYNLFGPSGIFPNPHPLRLI